MGQQAARRHGVGGTRGAWGERGGTGVGPPFAGGPNPKRSKLGPSEPKTGPKSRGQHGGNIALQGGNISAALPLRLQRLALVPEVHNRSDRDSYRKITFFFNKNPKFKGPDFFIFFFELFPKGFL